MMTKAFGKKLFGAGYEKITRSIIINIVLFGGLQAAGISLFIAPFICCLMTTILTIGEMWQALSAEDNSQNMKNMIMMPFDNREFVTAYVFSLGLYIFISRTMLVLALIFAVSKPDVLVIVNVLLCAVNGTVLTAVLFAQKKIRIIASIWVLLILAAGYFGGTSVYYSVFLVISIAAAILALLKADAYSFYIGDGKTSQKIKKSKKASVWVYIFRYMKSHKNYMVNTLFFWGLAVILPIFLKDLTDVDADLIKMVIPMGFAILCMNTPIGILLSCDKSLEQAVRTLPGQKKSFCLPYFGFIFVCNIIVEAIYLVSSQLQIGGVSKELVLAAVFFAVQGAIIAVLLEWFLPIRNWKIENDLWHHPRKYIMPGILIVLSGVVGVVPVAVYGLLAILVLESVYLLYSIR